ncbi:MAG TPA: S41 family peptidase [Candidatus Gracilibacteria bacterium]
MVHYQRNVRIVTYLLLPVLGFVLGWNLSVKNQHQQLSQVKEIQETPKEDLVTEMPITVATKYKKTNPDKVDMDIFWDTWGAMEANFLYKDKIKAQDLIYGATKGMIDALGDPYTSFLNPKDTDKFEENLSGEFQGIGAEIGIREERLTVISPLKKSPAELAGLRSGDQIYQIDGESTINITLEEAVLKIRGPKGEKVTLTVIREGERKPLDIVVVRDNIVIQAVEWRKEDDLAVIEISSFGNNVVREFSQVVSEIMLESPRGIILDLRNNPGGLLPDSVKVAGDFMPDKVIVKTRGLSYGGSSELRSGREGAFADLPLVVLANEGSASASEIFAGAVQDHHRGVIIGQKTYGKGSVQQVIPMFDGSSLKVTILEWLTPEGRSIHDIGIQPHEEVERTFENIDEGVDPQMERAIQIINNPSEYEAYRTGPTPTVAEIEEIKKEEDIHNLEDLKNGEAALEDEELEKVEEPVEEVTE